MDPDELSNPGQAAVSSAVVFTLGVVIPLIAIHDTAYRARNPPEASLTPSDGPARARVSATSAPAAASMTGIGHHRACRTPVTNRLDKVVASLVPVHRSAQVNPVTPSLAGSQGY
ncbi:hypothetical protein ABIA39_006987 [Nocardia sp. GAS34]|uniref:hypothetical protein n=1 Tax=unclassified Nocardia TaxID=2637762 RepID=UPI003D22DB03